MDSKVKRISVRVPQMWIKTLRERRIPISHTCRSALYQQMNQTDPVLQNIGKLRSKQRAASLYHSLQQICVCTIDTQNTQILSVNPIKLGIFREILIKKCNPGELMILGEFLDQGEYAEMILQDAYS